MAPQAAASTDEETRQPEVAEERQYRSETNLDLRELLRSWREETDPEELKDQRETLEYLVQALDEHRTHRKLFS